MVSAASILHASRVRSFIFSGVVVGSQYTISFNVSPRKWSSRLAALDLVNVVATEILCYDRSIDWRIVCPAPGLLHVHNIGATIMLVPDVCVDI
ncbi:hypothetical protein WN55_06988 [Dufourea novaeangliae]|uniref:Uncharacterized protein n=1 Tax=Dufourea novaeangliae TaxID=178035 RepID=A0A154P0Q7_DUFNO|nr:hypothetical protein WN55_06988 [Dufourea novaeangliae]